MNFLKPITYGLAVGVALAAFAMPVEKAEARVIGYSSLQVNNFQFVSGAEIINLGSVTVVNTTTSSANLNGVGTNDASPVNGAPGSIGVADSDVALSCVGACGGIGQNDYSQYSAANPGTTFARGDAALTGSLLTAGGATGQTLAESQLIGTHTSSAGGAIQSIANFTTIDFTTGQGGDLSLTFDVLGELLAFSDETGGVAIVDFDFNIVLQDRTNGGTISIGVSSVNGETDLGGLNELVSAVGIETQSYTISDTFNLTVSGLLANNNYRMQISQNSDVSASSIRQVAEPASMGLLGLGLLGVAGLVGRRRVAA